MELTGGCLCGAVRFRIRSEPLVAYYCHCSRCQKRSGAPVSAAATFPADMFDFTKGEPKIIDSDSPGLVRQLCGSCGSILGLRPREHPTLQSVRLGCLDDPSCVQPTLHIHTSSQVPWLKITDDLPCYLESAPEIDGLWAKAKE
jgi:hypothetical protein